MHIDRLDIFLSCPNSLSKGRIKVVLPVFVAPTIRGVRVVLDGPVNRMLRKFNAKLVSSKVCELASKIRRAATAYHTALRKGKSAQQLHKPASTHFGGLWRLLRKLHPTPEHRPQTLTASFDAGSQTAACLRSRKSAHTPKQHSWKTIALR